MKSLFDLPIARPFYMDTQQPPVKLPVYGYTAKQSSLFGPHIVRSWICNSYQNRCRGNRIWLGARRKDWPSGHGIQSSPGWSCNRFCLGTNSDQEGSMARTRRRTQCEKTIMTLTSGLFLPFSFSAYPLLHLQVTIR